MCLIDLQRILNISTDLIEFETHLLPDGFMPGMTTTLVPDIPMLELGDTSKFFSPYPCPEELNLFGRKIATNKKDKKPCVCLCIYRDSLQGYSEKNLNDTVLDRRHYPIDTNIQITKFIIQSGYDVISLNDYNISLEYKISILNELCDAVICYEGGMAHVAHLLKIPTMILPWRDTKKTVTEYIHGLHLDKKTWFIESLDQLTSMTPGEFKYKIHTLHNDQGNNLFLQPNKYLGSRYKHFLNTFELNLLNQYLPNPAVGGF